MSILQTLIHYFPHQPNEGQVQLFEKLAYFIQNKHQDSCFILKGYAGTGKTTAVSALVATLKQIRKEVVLLAPTGRAAKVLNNYSGEKASTIHRKIYKKKTSVGLDTNFGLSYNPHKSTLFIVDEASMISDDRTEFNRNSLLEDLLNYVYNQQNNAIIFIGDTAQLPPIHTENSPALSAEYLSRLTLDITEHELTEVVRQKKQSGILYNATKIREQIRKGSNEFPSLNTTLYKDVYRMGGDKIIEGLNYAYNKYDIKNTIVICRSNKSANIYNQHIRNQVLWRDEEITGGDLIMIVKNNYFWMPEEKGGFIANGETAKIIRVKNIREMYGFRFADAQIEIQDTEDVIIECKLLLDTLYEEGPSLSYQNQKRLYEEIIKDYEGIPRKQQIQELKQNPYYNALQIKFAYAVTCHKAQGGQWDAVFIDQGYITEEMMTIDFLRWLYSSTTRCTSEVFYVNFSSSLYSK